MTEPDTGRQRYERWLADNPEPADGNGCRGILIALLIVTVITTLIVLTVWAVSR